MVFVLWLQLHWYCYFFIRNLATLSSHYTFLVGQGIIFIRWHLTATYCIGPFLQSRPMHYGIFCSCSLPISFWNSRPKSYQVFNYFNCGSLIVIEKRQRYVVWMKFLQYFVAVPPSHCFKFSALVTNNLLMNIWNFGERIPHIWPRMLIPYWSFCWGQKEWQGKIDNEMTQLQLKA